MRKALARYRDFYGSSPLHLLLMIAGFAVLAYVIVIVTPKALWNTDVWWQSIAVWFAVAIIGHDLVLFPLYALADRLLTLPAERRSRQPRVPAINYIRLPLMGSALTLLVFLPGIIKQGAVFYVNATGQTQDPFLGRWLLLTAAMFGTSALAYAICLIVTRRRA
ncbi:MAG: hypothetical protein QOH60_4355 [Mycobacterium sp.]|nr:hypothetical protein [Mycobacterium sp.]